MRARLTLVNGTAGAWVIESPLIANIDSGASCPGQYSLHADALTMTRSASGIEDRLPYRTAPAAMLGGSSHLYRDFLRCPARVAGYFGPAFDDEAAIAALARQLQGRHYERELLRRVLHDLADESSAPDSASSQLDALLSPRSLVVFAGQQPGLFTGPLYSIYKALTAERWAADLSRRLSVAVVPCFWLASDDHDFAEVDHVHVPCGMQVTALRYAPAAAPSGEPVGRVVLDQGIEAVIGALAEHLPHCASAKEALDVLLQCYAPGARFSSAFARLWYRMFPRSALLFVTPDHPGLQRLAAPILQRAIIEDTPLFSLYSSTSAKLEGAGYHRQVHKKPGQTFLFNQRRERRSIQRDGNGNFVWEGAEPVSRSVLQQSIEDSPGDFSPNVLLRPIVQNALFPTLGVVLGPAETAYYAQLGGLHDHFDVPRPAILPRTSATLLEPGVAKRLVQKDIELTALRGDLDHVVAQVLRRRFPQDLDLKLQTATRQLEAVFAEVAAEVGRFDASLVSVANAASVRAGREMSRLARKAHAAHRRRERDTEAQIRSLALHLFPRGQPQERCFNIVYYWARYGGAFLDELHRQWPAARRDPVIWELQQP